MADTGTWRMTASLVPRGDGLLHMIMLYIHKLLYYDNFYSHDGEHP
jgi:hypothetical protein